MVRDTGYTTVGVGKVDGEGLGIERRHLHLVVLRVVKVRHASFIQRAFCLAIGVRELNPPP